LSEKKIMEGKNPDPSSKSDKNPSKKAIKPKGAPGKPELASTLAGKGNALLMLLISYSLMIK